MIITNVVDLKATAISLRKDGLSFSEIQKQLPVAKSTLSSWLKDLKLTPEQIAKLDKKRNETIRKTAEKKIAETRKSIEDVKSDSARAIGQISKRELWLMGIMLYWRERVLNRNDSDLKKGVRFTSSDPFLINLFLKWLHDIGRLGKDEIAFDIFISSNKVTSVSFEDKNEIRKNSDVQKIVDFWAVNTGFNNSYFSHIYVQKSQPTKGKRKISNKSEMGILRIRVKASSMLARQVAGWIEGVKSMLLIE